MRRIVRAGPLTVGAEFELQLLDSETLDLTDRVLPLMDSVGDSAFIKPEVIQNTVEVISRICGNASELESHLREQVRLVRDLSGGHGMRLCGAGTHPFSMELARVTPFPRYLAMKAEEGHSIQTQVTFATHVHVGVGSREEAIALARELAGYIPVLIAISANSPFWRGHATGHGSFRQRVLAASKSYGPPPVFSCWEDFEGFFEALRRANVIQGVRDLHWDVRPRPDLGTVEVRVMDAQQTAGEVASLAAFVRVLAGYLRSTPIEARPPLLPRPMHGWFEKQNAYQAARAGLDAWYIRNDSGDRVILAQVFQELMNELFPYYRAMGERTYFDRLCAILEIGPGFRIQLRDFQESNRHQDVVRMLVNRLETDLIRGGPYLKRAG